jgi:hypothetical protein
MVYMHTWTKSPEDKKLNLSIKPDDVRLIPSAEAPYKWEALPAAKHLFTKQLSKHCLGAYEEILERLEESFEAVLNDPLSDQNESVTIETLEASKRSSPEAELHTSWRRSKVGTPLSHSLHTVDEV